MKKNKLHLFIVKHWKLTRRYINTVFHHRNCVMLMPMLNQNSRELMSLLSPYVDKEPVDIFKPIMSIALKSALCE